VTLENGVRGPNRRLVEIVATTVLIAILAIAVVVRAVRSGEKLPWPPGVDFAAATPVDNYLDPRPAPEAPAADDPPIMLEAGKGAMREDFDSLAGWLRWRGPQSAIEEGALTIFDQPEYAPVLYRETPWNMAAGELEVRLQCTEGGFTLGLAEFRGTPWRELGGRLNQSEVRDGLFVYVNRYTRPHTAGMDYRVNDVQQFQTQAPIPLTDADEWFTLRIALAPEGAALAVDDVEYIAEVFDWPNVPRRIYMGTVTADTEVDYLAWSPVGSVSTGD